jgi:uracil-DNA glycosylase
MTGPPVTGDPAVTPVMLIGQAPGAKEIEAARPFAWTAGRTLFRWFGEIGLDEARFRQRVYMTAVCRCFPGKQARTGDRVPNRQEIANCRHWRQVELRLLRPRLLLPVGKLAISQFLPVSKLHEVVGQQFSVEVEDFSADLIPLPHPSGASVWHRTPPGRSLLERGLARIAAHPAWQAILQ